jgi:hypothetical protein
MPVRLTLVATLLAALFLLPSPASAVLSSAPVATATAGGLDWTVGSTDRSGCLLCHGNRNLVGIKDVRVVSLYTDTLALQGSAHGKHQCVDCHTGFTCEAPHSNAVGETWRTVAKSSCKNCHERQYRDWARSYHSTTSGARPGRPDSSAPGKPRPLCGDCHQGHAIPDKNDVSGRAAVHASALAMCGNCHVKAWVDYTDYYHGSAYRRGAPDAPACWQCHDTHRVLPSSNHLSSTYQDNLVATCSRCHKGAGQGFVQYKQLIHSLDTTYRRNPIVSAADGVVLAIGNVGRSILSAFGVGGS